MSLAVSSRSAVRRIPFSELQICGCCLRNGEEPLMACAKCSVLVHAHCYEPDKEVNPGTWICAPCAAVSPAVRETITCGICAMPGGALKPTDDDGWAHVCCAYWTPETYFSNRDVIVGVADIPTKRSSLRCIFCKKTGGCVQCTMGKCCTPFHLVCACQHGLQLSIVLNEDGTFVATSICPKHKQLTRKSRNFKAPCVTKIREEDAICDVCGHDSASENNDIVICDGCEVAVHQNCYGIQSIPENQWFCQSCSSDRPGKCILCADTDGALKQAANGDWVHVVCALWSHQAVFLKPSSLDGVSGLDRLLLDDPDRQCQFCHDAVGFCCDCAATDCNSFYHVRCARKDKRRVEIYDLKDPSNPLSTVPPLTSVNSQSELAFALYCNAHTSLPFSSEDYQRDHPFPLLENGLVPDHDANHASNDATRTSSKKRNRRLTSVKTTAKNAAADDAKRSQADIFWQDEVQPYFESPCLSALRLSKDFGFASDFSLMLPPLAKSRSTSLRPSWPSYKSCDWICEQLSIPCEKVRRLYALLVLNEDSVFTNFYEGTIINFCLVETSNIDCELAQELTKCQKHLATQIRELDGFRKLIRAKIGQSPSVSAPFHRDVVALHKNYVDMSHSQIVRLSLVAGFRDLDIAASDFTQEHFNTTCRVCFGTEGNEVNPIVICEHCGLAVHKYCYGINVIPEGDWLCDSCCGASIPSAGSECALCPLDGFAFKSSDFEGQTVHLVCALWCPQVRIADMVKMGPIKDLESALGGDRLECTICNQDRGVTVSCRNPECPQRFHVTCAWEFGLFLEVKSADGKPCFNCFCVEHTPQRAGGPERDRLKQRELRLKARTQKPLPPPSGLQSPVAGQAVVSTSLAHPRVLDGEDTYLQDVCAVCFSSTPDELCKCVSCAIAVHRECYNIDSSVSEFRCTRCLAQPQRARKVSCVYCPRMGGAYERHESARWRHKTCERWAVIFRNNGDRLFSNTVCAVCDRREGFCIPCTAQDCTAKFHALCGLFVGCELRQEDQTFMALCPLHTPVHGDSRPIKDGVPDLFVFYDRLRLIRADMDELRTIMDLIKKRERLKRGVASLRFEIESEVSCVQSIQNRIKEDECREAERQEHDHLRLIQSLQTVIEDGEFDFSELEDGEIREESIADDPMQIANDGDASNAFSDRDSTDVDEDAGKLTDLRPMNVPAPVNDRPLSPRRLDFGLLEQDVDVEASREEMENLHLADGIPDTIIQTAAKDGSNASDTAIEHNAAEDPAESNEEPQENATADHRQNQGHPDDHGDDEDSDEDPGRDRKDGRDDRPRRNGRKNDSSTDDEESADSEDVEAKPLVSVHEKRINRWATRFRIKIDRSQLPISTKIKIKKSLLRSSAAGSQSEPAVNSRGRRRSRVPEPTPASDEDDENVAAEQDESEAEPTGRRRRRRSLRSQPGSETEDFASDFRTPLRRHTARTAALADRQPKDSEDADEIYQKRWSQDELDYLRDIIANTESDPDWSVVVQLLEDKFGASQRIYSKAAVQSRWARISGSYSRKQSPAPSSAEPHSQRTRWPAEELEYLRSIVANTSEEGKRNWPDIVRQMKKKFGRQYRDYTPQILQSKVHRLLNPPEPVEPKEHVRKPAVKPSSKVKWANEELEYLRGLVNKLGTEDWIEIANLMDKFLGERHRTYTGPILQKKWRDIGPRGQAGVAQEIRDDMIANPVPQEPADQADDEEAESDADRITSEENLKEALSKQESGPEDQSGAEDSEERDLPSPVIEKPAEPEAVIETPTTEVAEELSVPESHDLRSANAASPVMDSPIDRAADTIEQEITPADQEVASSAEQDVRSGSEQNAMDVDIESADLKETPPGNHDSPSQSGKTAIDGDVEVSSAHSANPEESPSAEPDQRSELRKNAIDVDVVDNASVELRSPLAQAAPSPKKPSEVTLSKPSESLPEAGTTQAAEEPFEEVPWHLEPEDDDELIRTPIQQPPLLLPQSAGDSLFPGPIPAFVMTQGERDSSETLAKTKANAWRDEEMNYLTELGADPQLRKDWETIAEKMTERFGTSYRKYVAGSIKQRWANANRQKSRLQVVAGKEPRRPSAAKEPRRHQPVEEPVEVPIGNKVEQEGITKTPYHREELAYLSELCDQFGSKDWSRVAQRMQLRFGYKYRRYAPMSLSMKWARLRSKNQVPPHPSEFDDTASELPTATTAEMSAPNPVAEESDTAPVAQESVPESLVEKSEIEPSPALDAQESNAKRVAPESEPHPESDQRAIEPVAEDLNLEGPVSEAEQEPVEGKVPLSTPGRKGGRNLYTDEERTFLHSLFREHGKNFKKICDCMKAKFGKKYRTYMPAALQHRWNNIEQFAQDDFSAPALEASPDVSGQTPEISEGCKQLTAEHEPESAGVASKSSPEPVQEPSIVEDSETLEVSAAADVSEPEVGKEDNIETHDVEAVHEPSLNEGHDEEAASRDSRRSRKSRTKTHPELILTSRTRAGRLSQSQPVAAVDAAAEAPEVSETPESPNVAEASETPEVTVEAATPATTRGQRSIVDKTPKRSIRTPGRKVAKGTEETDTDEEAAEPSNAAPTTVSRSRGKKAHWQEDELEFLRSAAHASNNDWEKVAQLMDEKFGKQRRMGYTAIAVMTSFRRRFQNDGVPSARTARSATASVKRARSVPPGEKSVSPRRSRARGTSPAPEVPAARSPSPKPAESVGSPLAAPSDIPSPAPASGRGRRSSPSRTEPARKRRSIGSDSVQLIEKVPAAVDSEPEPATPAIRRRRGSEIPPITTPKRRRITIPGTEPRKPKAKIPNQGINRLDRLIQNLQDNDFKADDRNKALKFLRAHQSKWRQQRAMSTSDKAFVLDSWQFKPYEVKIVQVLENGERYRIHYLNWSSKFDEDLPGEFVFRDSPEIRHILEMANTYSKAR